MSQVKGEYPDYTKESKKSYFSLNADQAFNFNTWNAPIYWKGTVDGYSVSFIQVDDYISGLDSIEWIEFPDKLKKSKPYIIKGIDRAMEVMN